MTEWWLILAFFWLWFLADSLKISRRPRFLASGTCGRRAHLAHGHALTSAPTPLTWHAPTDDPLYSVSPDGVCNLPAGSAGRPGPDPEPARAWRWEDIREVKQKRGRILINGVDFCPVTVFANAAALRTLAAHLVAQPSTARAALLSAHLSAWFRPAHLRRRRLVLLARTRGLAELGVFNFSVALLLTGYLLANGPALVGDAWAARLAHALPLIGGYFAFVHLATLVLAWRAHRRLLPKQSEQRVSLILNAALMPPYALRLRAQIAAAYFPPQHALTWLAASSRPTDLATFARNVLTDLRWPLPPRRQENAPLVASVHAWTQAEIIRHAERLLSLSSVLPAQLLAAPPADSAASCAYCPRCGDQFTDPNACCPRGVKLLALK
jgi:hypothetical protein